MIILLAYLDLMVWQLDIIRVYLTSFLLEKETIYIVILNKLYIQRKLKKY